MIWIKHGYDNPDVTEYYISIIANAYRKMNQNVQLFVDWSEISSIDKKADIVVVSYHTDAFYACMQKMRYVYWIQGIVPEETYAIRHDRLRSIMLTLIEYLSIRHAEFVFYVSDYMRIHYERKYKLQKRNYYIMPCSNDTIKETSFSQKKYESPVFCYAGGIAKWQCLDQTIQMYKSIEEHLQNAKLLLLVRDKAVAQNLAIKNGIKNYEIDFVKIEDLPERVKDVKYGFIIREDLELNRVATPTKLMTYLGNGIIPIMSECLYGLMECMDNSEYCVKVPSSNDIGPVLEFEKKNIDSNKLLCEYQKIFQMKYSSETHINALSGILPH